MEWWLAFLGFLAGFIPTLPGWFMLSRQRAKADAETAKTNAETAATWQDLYDGLIESLTADNGRLTQERDLERETTRDLRLQLELVLEQKTAAIGHNQLLTARIAMMGEANE